MPISNKTFSQNLARIRKDRGMSQLDLANKSGISRRMIGHYETHVSTPPLDKIQILADSLEITVSDLLGLEEKQSKRHEYNYDLRLLKKIKQLSQFNNEDRQTIYKMIDSLSHKPENQQKSA